MACGVEIEGRIGDVEEAQAVDQAAGDASQAAEQAGNGVAAGASGGFQQAALLHQLHDGVGDLPAANAADQPSIDPYGVVSGSVNFTRSVGFLLILAWPLLALTLAKDPRTFLHNLFVLFLVFASAIALLVIVTAYFWVLFLG